MLTREIKNLDNDIDPILMKKKMAVCMNKICIFAKNPNTYFLKKLRGLVGYHFELFNPWETLPDFDLFSQILIRTTGVYGNDRDLELLENVPDKKLLNNLSVLKMFRGKDTQYEYFKKTAIPHIPWLVLLNSSSSQRENFLKSFGPHKSFLIKPLRGQGGWGIEVLKGEHLEDWWRQQDEKGDLSYLIQPYVEKALECRVFFIKENFQLALERMPVKGVAANFTQDGEARPIEVPGELSKIVTKIIQDTGMSYGAMDCLFYEGQWIVLEVNAVPGIEQLEKVTGLDIAGEFARRLLTP